jgi:RHS repeat-associated protein
LYDPAGNRTTEQINNSVTTSAYNDLNQFTSRTGGGMLTISGSLSQPAMMTVGGGTPFITGSVGNTFSAQAAVVTGSNNIQISATNVNGYGITQTLGVNVTSGTPISGLTYDLNGNLTFDGTNNYVWDSANRLIQIWYGPIGSSASTSMTYDGLGHRAQIVETGSTGTVTATKNLVWDGMTICEEKNASDVVTKAYFDQGVQLNGSDYYYTRDHLGSIREVTDTNANVQAEYAYDPYGRQTQTSGTMTFDFGFTGQYYHQPSGLMLAPYRGYSPSLGRWISRDPIANAELSQGVNLYWYVSNNSCNSIDPMGTGDWGDGVYVNADCELTEKCGTRCTYECTCPDGYSLGLGGVFTVKQDCSFAPPKKICTDDDYIWLVIGIGVVVVGGVIVLSGGSAIPVFAGAAAL